VNDVGGVVVSGRRVGNRYLFTVRHVCGHTAQRQAADYDAALRWAQHPCERCAPPRYSPPGDVMQEDEPRHEGPVRIPERPAPWVGRFSSRHGPPAEAESEDAVIGGAFSVDIPKEQIGRLTIYPEAEGTVIVLQLESGTIRATATPGRLTIERFDPADTDSGSGSGQPGPPGPRAGAPP
jgi:hypothetical protein